MNATPINVTANSLEEFVTEIFKKAGCNSNDARTISQCLVQTNLWGIDSHGVLRVAKYLDRLHTGGMNANPDIQSKKAAPGLEVLDADNGSGYVAATAAMNRAIGLAKKGNIAAVAAINSNHCGATSLYARMAIEHGIAILSLMRAEPRRAETALEDLSDLFRVLMADNRKLIPLQQELGLCRQYLAIETLRLEERLQIDWRIDGVPEDAMVPPLILQPLLENAVYHGIEPAAKPGVVSIRIERKSDRLEMVLSNPLPPSSRQQSGNKMALANISERLQLHFDAEASLATRSEDGRFEVRIVLPYVKERQ